MPPPPAPEAAPLLIVRPRRVTGFATVEATSNTREALLPLTVSWPAPGPAMVRFFLMSSSPLVSVMVWKSRLGAKTMVSPLWAAAMSARSEPAPLSRLFVTVSVPGTKRSSRLSRQGPKVRCTGRDLLVHDGGPAQPGVRHDRARRPYPQLF